MYLTQLEARETKQNGSGKYGTDYATVNITMIDENDHFPEFENITEAKATDKDMDFFGTKGIRYSLVEGSFSNSFAIDKNSGNLTVKTNDHGLNREKISSFYITIAAQDNNGTGNRNMLLLKIILLDANDQVPTFVLQSYKAYMFENSKKFTENLVLLATDLDEENTNNSRVKYQLIDSNNFILCETNSDEPKIFLNRNVEIACQYVHVCLSWRLWLMTLVSHNKASL
ncbi:cadherin-86C-like isoform X3 [Tachypleus tridentatus]|uniref:cadherin-86C-like isoform X3 n=1 Tax=Tachypleus tridentatus TaxID=6853 RepID=UPI003FD12A67